MSGITLWAAAVVDVEGWPKIIEIKEHNNKNLQSFNILGN
jgi:hypothetical protein